jgi:hypothetical protein
MNKSISRLVIAQLITLTAVLILTTTGAICFADDPTASTADQGILPVPDYSGEIGARSNLTGDWAGVRQNWADRGVTMAIDWYQAYQDIIDGGFEEGSENSTIETKRRRLNYVQKSRPRGNCANEGEKKEIDCIHKAGEIAGLSKFS